MRRDEVGTQRAFINTEQRWGPPLVGADWRAFCQAIYKGIEGKEWEELYYHNREMSQAAGAEKPSESHQGKALWAMKAAWKTRQDLWEEHLKDPIAALAKGLGIHENSLSFSAGFWFVVCCSQSWWLQ